MQPEKESDKVVELKIFLDRDEEVICLKANCPLVRVDTAYQTYCFAEKFQREGIPIDRKRIPNNCPNELSEA